MTAPTIKAIAARGRCHAIIIVRGQRRACLSPVHIDGFCARHWYAWVGSHLPEPVA